MENDASLLPTENDVKYERKWWVLASVAVGVFLGTIDGSIVNVTLPVMVRDLAAPLSLVQWVVLAYIIAMALLLLPCGRPGDWFGKRTVYLVGLVLFIFASALCGLAWNVYALIAFRIVQGIGAAMMTSLGMGIVTESFPARERGKALGMIGTVVSAGIITGPTVGGLLVHHFSWRTIFLVNVPIGIVGLFIVLRNMPQTPKRVSERLIDLGIFRNLDFSLGVITAFIVFLAISGVGFLMPFFLQDIAGFDVDKAGLLLASVPIIIGIIAPFAGSLSDKIGTRSIRISGLCLLLIGVTLLPWIPKEISSWEFVLRFVPYALGLGLFQSSNNSSMMGGVAQKDLGMASSLISLFRTVGSAVGIAIFANSWNFLLHIHPVSGGNKPLDPSSGSDVALRAMQQTLYLAVVFVFMALLLGFFGADRKVKVALQK